MLVLLLVPCELTALFGRAPAVAPRVRVGVLGGGFAGLTAARTLAANKDVEVLLLDQRDSHTTWRAHAGAAPVHSGGKKLSGSWTPPAAKGAPWRLALAGPMAAVNFKQLFVGGERATRAPPTRA